MATRWPSTTATRPRAEVDRGELRALQAPLEELYRGEPNAALVTLRTSGATSLELPVAGVVRAEGELIFAGRSGSTRPHGTRRLSQDPASVELDADADDDDEQLKTLIGSPSATAACFRH